MMEDEWEAAAPPAGWWLAGVMRKEARKWDWVALMSEQCPLDDPAPGLPWRSCWVRIPGKHRNQELACDVFEAMRATKH